MISKIKTLLSVTLLLTLVPMVASAQSSTKKKKAKATTTEDSSTTTPSDSPAPSVNAMPSQGVRVAPGEVLNFNTDGASTPKDNAQSAPLYNFKESTEPMQPTVIYNDAVADETPFKAYIGYPKHHISLSGAPTSVAAIWNYNGQDINFNTNTTTLGLAYELAATPRFGLGANYQHSSMAVTEATVSTYKIESSSSNYDTYFLEGHYCFFGNGNFNIQYCPALSIGNDAYPILTFLSATHLRMDGVRDITWGLHFRVQFPVTDRLVLHVTPGFSSGTGIGNSGALTSKNNSTIYLIGGARYDFNTRHAVSVDGEFQERSAKLSGTTGNNQDTWTTKATEIGVKLAYILTL